MRGPPLLLLAATACLSPPDEGESPVIDAAPGVVGTCAPGALIAGVPFDPGPNPTDSCGLQNVLERDGLVTGLDRAIDSECEAWIEGSEACSCVGLDLGGVMPVARFAVVAGATGDACGRFECSECGTGHDFTAWYGAELDEHIHAGDLLIDDGAELVEHTITVGADVRYVAVCRNGWGEGRDDVAVDAIEVVCGD